MATKGFKMFSMVLALGFLGWLIVFLYTEKIQTEVVPYEDRLKLLLDEFNSKPLLFDLAKVSDPPDIGESLLQKQDSWLRSFLHNEFCPALSPTSPHASRALVTADGSLLVCDINPRTRKLWKHVNQMNGDLKKVADLTADEMMKLYASSNTKKILVTRNPFSQVLAVYVDMFFMPNTQGWQRHGAPAIRASTSEWRQRHHLRDEPCYHDTTFPEYLVYLLQNNQTAPELLSQIQDKCDSCSSRYDIVLRHETLWQKLLSESGPVQVKQMWDAAGEEQIWEDIQRYQADRVNVSRCIPPYEALQKLWRSWQIFGILEVGANFPFSSPEEAKMASPERFRKLAVQAMSAEKSDNKTGRIQNEIMALKEVFAETKLETKLKLEFLLRETSQSQGYKPDPYFLYQSNGVFFREDLLSLFSIKYA